MVQRDMVVISNHWGTVREHPWVPLAFFESPLERRPETIGGKRLNVSPYHLWISEKKRLAGTH